MVGRACQPIRRHEVGRWWGLNPVTQRTVRLRALAAAALPIAATACGTPASEAAAAGQDPGATIRDSAGIEIVESHAPVWGPGDFWTVDPEPEFVLGGLGESGDSAHLIWQVRGAKPLSDGRIAMLTPGGDRKVLVYEPTTGRLSAAFARSGRGPGEFFHPVGMQVLPGDTIAVWDFMFGPVYYFDPSGRIVRERRIDWGPSWRRHGRGTSNRARSRGRSRTDRSGCRCTRSNGPGRIGPGWSTGRR